jgi:lysyl-tRNA synthetase class I
MAGHEFIDQPKAFKAIYAAFLGRANGPRAGWLLASLDLSFVVDRLIAAGGLVGSVE